MVDVSLGYLQENIPTVIPQWDSLDYSIAAAENSNVKTLLQEVFTILPAPGVASQRLCQSQACGPNSACSVILIDLHIISKSLLQLVY